MVTRFKAFALSCVAALGILVALGGLQPMSIGSLHQPELPKSCK